MKIIAFILIFAVFVVNIFLIPVSDGFYNQQSNDVWFINSIILFLVDLIIIDTLRSWVTVFFIS